MTLKFYIYSHCHPEGNTKAHLKYNKIQHSTTSGSLVQRNPGRQFFDSASRTELYALSHQHTEPIGHPRNSKSE